MGWHSKQMCPSFFSHTHKHTLTQLTYMKATVIVLGSQLGNHNDMPFTSYNINICFDLVGRVEILLGKLLHYGFSIRHPCRQAWKYDKLTERNILMLWKTYCISFFCLYCKEYIWGHGYFYALSEEILYCVWAMHHWSWCDIFNTGLWYHNLLQTTQTHAYRSINMQNQKVCNKQSRKNR